MCFEKCKNLNFFPTLQIKKNSFLKKIKNTKNMWSKIEVTCAPKTCLESISNTRVIWIGEWITCNPNGSCYNPSTIEFAIFYIFSNLNILWKRAFLNLKGGKKAQIFGFFETQKLDFLRNKLSVEKTFLSQEAGMIRLSFDWKSFLIEAT